MRAIGSLLVFKNKSNQERVGTFLYSIGDCADDIVKTLSIREATVSFDEFKTALSGYFAGRRKTPSEPVDTFIQDLYCLAEKCEYRTLRDELIRDRIIAGVLDDPLSDRPQAGFDLILTDAACMSRQTKARKPNRTICPWVRNSKRS